MAHGKWLVNPAGVGTSLALEDVTVTLLSNGYPQADKLTAQAAGLPDGIDYTVYTATQTGGPTVPANSIAIVPKSLVGTTSAANCYVLYTATTTAPPSVSVSTTDSSKCN
jgi:MSHA pilin protein MshA